MAQTKKTYSARYVNNLRAELYTARLDAERILGERNEAHVLLGRETARRTVAEHRLRAYEIRAKREHDLAVAAVMAGPADAIHVAAGQRMPNGMIAPRDMFYHAVSVSCDAEIAAENDRLKADNRRWTERIFLLENRLKNIEAIAKGSK